MRAVYHLSPQELDLANPKTFRVFSKPMGAQSEERLLQFQKRYREWEDPTGETPPCHYGTHYSSAMIVASYLIRLEPFTQHFLRLQVCMRFPRLERCQPGIYPRLYTPLWNPLLTSCDRNLLSHFSYQGSKFKSEFGSTCATRCKFLGALPKF